MNDFLFPFPGANARELKNENLLFFDKMDKVRSTIIILVHINLPVFKINLGGPPLNNI